MNTCMLLPTHTKQNYFAVSVFLLQVMVNSVNCVCVCVCTCMAQTQQVVVDAVKLC